jgi:tRNA(Ile)-lysidine synthase
MVSKNLVAKLDIILSMQARSLGITWENAIKRCSDYLTSLYVNVDGKDILLAVSGGMDSMCMLALMARTKAKLSVAHVNYGLRGADSDADADLVKSTCQRMGITLYEKHVDIRTLAGASDESLQQSGRRIRYEWFEELCHDYHYEFTCTAHHKDDAAETFFVNLLRGTGLKGLAGIPPVRGKILRPMLCFSRAEIQELVNTERIAFRHDVSNTGRDYLRNRIRHDIVPLLQKERMHFIDRMYSTQQRLNEEYTLLTEYLEKLKAELHLEDRDKLILDREKLLAASAPAVVLLYIVQKFGFSMTQCRNIVSSKQYSGTRYLSPSHELLIDRDHIIIVSRNERKVDEEIHIEGDGRYVVCDGILAISYLNDLSVYSSNPNSEIIDSAKMTGRLKLRRWHKGDFFYPLGGPGRMKLQDFFTNEKLSMTDKENVWILTSDDAIVWIVGKRLDHRYRVSADTREFMLLEWKPDSA